MSPEDPIPRQLSLWHAVVLIATGATIALIAIALAQSDRVIEASRQIEQTQNRTAECR